MTEDNRRDAERTEDVRALQIARFVDGELSLAERETFAAEIAADPELDAEVEELRALRGHLAVAEPAPVVVDAERFRGRVLAAVVAAAAATEESTESRQVAPAESLGRSLEPAPVLALNASIGVCRWAIWAALAVLALGAAVSSGLLRFPDSGRVEASGPELRKAMDDLDAKARERRQVLETGSSAPRSAAESRGR